MKNPGNWHFSADRLSIHTLNDEENAKIKITSMHPNDVSGYKIWINDEKVFSPTKDDITIIKAIEKLKQKVKK